MLIWGVLATGTIEHNAVVVHTLSHAGHRWWTGAWWVMGWEWRRVTVIQENVSTTPTMVVLVTACLSWRGLSCLGGRLQLLHHGRGAVELPNRRGPREVLDHFNLYCKRHASHHRRKERDKSHKCTMRKKKKVSKEKWWPRAQKKKQKKEERNW